MNNTNVHRILIPVDFSPAGECAIERGAYLANLFNAGILILHVLEDANLYPHEWVSDKELVNVTNIISKKADEKLSEYTGKIIKKYGVQVQSLIITGKPADKIVETVEIHDIDLVVMGTHGAKGFEEYFIGSNANKVVNLSPCPVLTIREGSQVSAIKSIVLPIDDCLHSRQKVNNVLAIASKCKADIYILGLVQHNRADDIGKMNIKIESVEKMVEKAGLKYIKKVLKGNNIAAEAIKYAILVDADMLAIMTDHESNLTGMFMGSFAQQIVNHSKIPVISIKPIKSTYEMPT